MVSLFTKSNARNYLFYNLSNPFVRGGDRFRSILFSLGQRPSDLYLWLIMREHIIHTPKTASVVHNRVTSTSKLSIAVSCSTLAVAMKSPANQGIAHFWENIWSLKAPSRNSFHILNRLVPGGELNAYPTKRRSCFSLPRAMTISNAPLNCWPTLRSIPFSRLPRLNA